MRVRFQPSFAPSLVLLVALVAAPFALLASWLAHDFSENAKREAEERFLLLARSLAADIDRELEQAILRLELLGNNIRHTADLAALDEAIRRLLKPLGFDVTVHDQQGRQAYNSAAPAGASLPVSANPNLLAETRNSGQPTISNLVVGSYSKEMLVSVSSRLPENGSGFSTIALAIYPQRLAQILSGNGLPAEYRWALLDRDYKFIARSHDYQSFIGTRLPQPLIEATPGKEGVGWTGSVEGVPILRAYAKSPKSGFISVIAVNAETILAPLRQAWIRLGIGAAFLASIALAGGYWAGRRLTSSLRTLAGAASDLGKSQVVAPAAYPVSEFTHIHEALRLSAARLQENEQHRQTLVQETIHRSRNLLSMVIAVVNNTLRRSPSTNEAQPVLEGRLQALAHSFDLLQSDGGQAVDLDALVKKSLELFTRDQYSISGPAVRLGPHTAQRAALLLHELCTNAVKYGALSNPAGKVDIGWSIADSDGTPTLTFAWKESGGPPVEKPSRRGFGTLLYHAAAFDPQCPPEVHFEPSGLHLRMTAPVKALAD
ncbi:MAG TPA: sensor histidine kinase [Hyphomicrobiaceae bacterium]|nr:sensor histidine kinase [Hyphomicrobiaceae bacterium]